MKCKCGWKGDIQEAAVWVHDEKSIDGHFELECPKCQTALSSEKGSKQK